MGKNKGKGDKSKVTLPNGTKVTSKTKKGTIRFVPGDVTIKK